MSPSAAEVYELSRYASLPSPGAPVREDVACEPINVYFSCEVFNLPSMYIIKESVYSDVTS